MDCPHCGTVYEQEARRCLCGYVFTEADRERSSSGRIGRIEPFDQGGLGGLVRSSSRVLAAVAHVALVFTTGGMVLTLGPAAGFAWLGAHDVVELVPLADPFWWVLLWAATAIAIDAVAHGDSPNVGDTLLWALTRLWSLVLGLITWVLLVVLGVALGVVPGLVWGARYVFGPLATLIDAAPVAQAFHFSDDALRGRNLQGLVLLVVPAAAIFAAGAVALALVWAAVEGDPLAALASGRGRLEVVSGRAPGGLTLVGLMALASSTVQLTLLHAVVLYRSMRYDGGARARGRERQREDS